MNEQLNNDDLEHKKRRRELYVILAVIPLIILLSYAESHISLISGDVPIATNILVLGLININIILLLLLIFLVLRNAVKLVFSSTSNVMGSKLRTKLVASFVGLTIIPTFLLFFFVVGFINKSIDSWFDIRIDEALEESLVLAQNYYKDTSERILSLSKRASVNIADIALIADAGLNGDIGLNAKAGGLLNEFMERLKKENDFSAMEIYSEDLQLTVSSRGPDVPIDIVPEASMEQLEKARGGLAASYIDTMQGSDVIRGISPVLNSENSEVIGVVVVSYFVPRSLIAKMQSISVVFENYKQQKLLKNPVKATYFMILLIITLLIVFLAVWIGRYIAKGITVPIYQLAEGTHAVASGNLDYKIKAKSSDEIGLLVNAFNRMTVDLKTGKSEIERANLELRGKNFELEQRRRYIEFVLENVTAGVLSIDNSGRIISINKVAADMLGTQESQALRQYYDKVLSPEKSEILKGMIIELSKREDEVLEKQIKLKVMDKMMTVLVNFNSLHDERGNAIGIVAVFDDLTHLLKTQRMFAWKEVARRIAHEIKNPLTPIQLSAQRLRKKYMDKFPDDAGVFDDCTMTIIRQVDELKTLVNEFSSFARMPTANPSPNNLNEIVSEIVAFYQSGNKRLSISSKIDSAIPTLNIDRDQIKRVIINLVDNAIAAIDDTGTIGVNTYLDPEKMLARLEVVDTGEGIPAEDKLRLFEPYFSTKKSGTGLGLAIVSNIISDHNGYIRVKDNLPTGTRFTIEFPIEAVPI
ncbi:MAG: ATP-binding protein [Thermodesulfobacteriota bacterium]